MRRLYATGLLAMACTTDGGTATSGESTAGENTGSADTMVASESTAPTDSGTPTASGSAGDSTSTTEGEPDSTGTPDTEVPGDCRTLLEHDPDTPDGVYTLHVGGDPEGSTFDAYCDMTTDGGGWTLVGRSVAGDWDVPFGWQQATGDVNNDSTPYSLDALAAQLEFSQILLGTYDTGKTWGANAYVVPAPQHFVFVYGRVPFAVMPETVIGDCLPDPEGDNIHHTRNIGWTELDSVFFAADYPDATGDGLEVDGWDTDHEVPECSDGVLSGLQGMLMVR